MPHIRPHLGKGGYSVNAFTTLRRMFHRVRSRKWTPGGKHLPVRCPVAVEELEGRCLPSTLGTSAITGNFNGTAIAAGSTIWFTSAFKVQGLPSAGATFDFTNDTIAFTVNGQTTTVDAPNAEVTLSPSASTATTTFDAAGNTWVTTLPMQFSGSGFLNAVELPVPNGLPGGIQNVTWQGQFSSTAGLNVQWQWAAAVYTQFSTNYNALDVKPVDDNHVSAYQNSDHAGTPEGGGFLPYVVGGATGGGGSNFTGSLSATASVSPAAESSFGLSGSVTDQNNNPLANVTVTLTNTQTNQTFTTTTNSNGGFSFSGLLGGLYTLTVTPPSGDTNLTDSAGTTNGSISSILLGPGSNTLFSFTEQTQTQSSGFGAS
jgi:Carboxypeptidase regulatory-like domain